MHTSDPQDFQRTFLHRYSHDILLGPSQAYIIGSLIWAYQRKCNMLVFGAGNDSILWHDMNERGLTLFMETNPEWIKKCKIAYPQLLIELYDTAGTTVGKSLAEIGMSATPPPAMIKRDWDIILIDGPEGYNDKCPGRALPIVWSAQIAKEHTHVFIDDFERKLESAYGEKCFGKMCIIQDGARKDPKSLLAYKMPMDFMLSANRKE